MAGNSFFNLPRKGSDVAQFYRSFYGRNLLMLIKARVFVPGRPFQLTLMFAQTGAYPSEEPFKYSNIGQAPILIRKRQTWVERPAWHKRPSLLQKFVNYSGKKVRNFVLWSVKNNFFLMTKLKQTLLVVKCQKYFFQDIFFLPAATTIEI